MTKKERWRLILELVRTNDVLSDKALQKLLRDRGVEVSLADIASDIRSLQLVYALRTRRSASASDLDADLGLNIEIPARFSAEKQIRHRMIIELFVQFGDMTQMELVSRLAERGIDVRQATVSRDLMELRSYVPADVVSLSPPRPRIPDDVRHTVRTMKAHNWTTSEIADVCSISAGSVARIVSDSKDGGE